MSFFFRMFTKTRDGWMLAGLFFATLATLMLEVLDTRLLSVLTWYHLSFLAVSVAMLGMAAGAVFVFVGGELFTPARAPRLLEAISLAFAVSLAACHIGNLMVPIPAVQGGSAAGLAALAVTTVLLMVPFVLSGIVVTLALTRSGGAIGRLYAADLVGAALGCLVVIWLLERSNITSAALTASGVAAIASWCFARRNGRLGVAPAVVAIGLFTVAVGNAGVSPALGIFYPKSRSLWLNAQAIDYSAWNAHSNVIVRTPEVATAFYWGAAADAPATPVTIAWAAVDGDAGTALTEWDGRRESLDWVQYDVTALPYQIRNGRAAIIGVGGGRDVLTALWAGNEHIVGIEINGGLVEAHRGRYRNFTRIADHPAITLVHDEARSYLTRVPERFDVIQMSLIDTWAATGAGAFTLSENGLYTRDGWRVFLNALSPSGVFSVSRWFDPESASETTRLLSLGVAALLDRGVERPREHLVLITRGRVATLMVSPQPFTTTDRDQLRASVTARGYTALIDPWDQSSEASATLNAIAAARTFDELDRAAADPIFDYSAPTDARPFFFNMLKPRALFAAERTTQVGVVSGNQQATLTLIALAGITAVLVAGIVGWPLLAVGRPVMPGATFGAAVWYFATIGMGFMFVQIPFLQRFSVYLGHPTYTFSVILFLMILSAGAGSFVSDRLDLRTRLVARLPFTIAAGVLLAVLTLQAAMDATVAWPLAGRTVVVAAFVAPLAFLMGFCFPIGMRLIGRHSDQVTAWMWGVNGAMGVMASVLAVMGSLWVGIHANLVLAAFLYALLWIPMTLLARSEPLDSRREPGASA